MTSRWLTPIAAAAALVILGAVTLMSADSPAEETPRPAEETPRSERPTDDFPAAPEGGFSLATFGGGCFWCTEAVFEETAGVHSAISGYSGGQTINPTYEAVCSGATGHAEVIQVAYDPSKIAYKDLLEIFFRTHDPTTLNRQGADQGTQYRSVIYFHDDEQKRVAEEVKKSLDASGAFNGPIVTEISPLDVFYKAEAYHQDYYKQNPSQGYCRAVIAPKMAKYREAFADRLKDD